MDACEIKQEVGTNKLMMEALYHRPREGKKFIKDVFVSYEGLKCKLSGVTGLSNLIASLQEQELSSAW